MKKTIKLLAILYVLALSSCTNPLNESIIEPIEISVLKGIIEKDTLFEYTYKAIQEIRDGLANKIRTLS